MIETKNLKVIFKTPRGPIKAVDNVNVAIREKEIIALVGESGSGKTTLGKTILGLIKPTEGEVIWNGINISELKGRKLNEFRLKNQIIYQDPFDAIDIRMRVYDVVAEGIRLHHLAKSKQEEREMIYNILKSVGLSPPEQFSVAYPTQLSGGQLQRVAIARAIVLNPEFLVADEPVSMLDVSIRADILNIFLDLREERGTSILMITHDLATAAYVADRIYVMYLGKVIEFGRVDQIVDNPKHPYTQALISSIPIPEPGYVIQTKLNEPDSPVPANGCPLYPRCPFRKDICKKEEPRIKEVEPEHYVACHLY
ncbi:ABC transporter ATP-binding protein [Sulfurisphaera javensis]|uniref:ABC transporter ATP-binding protein n=1 Tax=Sulfurisphaera javensis TaxID=2049879 RepID=A0AAT9GSH7_9CREN